MEFINDAHEDFVRIKFSHVTQDTYHLALVYTLGLCAETRNHWDSLYNEETRSINWDSINQGWQTSGTLQITRLAFNLFCDTTPSEDIDDCDKYSVSNIFCSEYAPYFVEAVKMRYINYF